ncbi:MAG: tungsten formylmethanofuran dehydrogenase [Acidimicrobiaceae bacterium]|nr:tungsten formylmethanofuran dehydrogenase [Acidimicrobiaceae bacterium]
MIPQPDSVSGSQPKQTPQSDADRHIIDLSNLAHHHDLGLSDKDLREMYEIMLTSRLVDQKIWNLNRMGKAPFSISSSGHEAIHAGISKAIKHGEDWVLPYYRDLGLLLGLGMTPYEAFLGIFAKAEDPNSGGRQMPNHWSLPRARVVTGSSPIATQLPHAAGIAYGLKLDGSSEVVICDFGDGATSKGDFHEALNFAGIHDLPVIFICENNGYAISVPLAMESAVTELYKKAAAYNIEGVRVDGNNPMAVYLAVKSAVEKARSGGGATFIEAIAYRFGPHTSDDDDQSYRSREEVAAAKADDPIIKFADYLTGHGVASDFELLQLKDQLIESINNQASLAQEVPDPTPDSVGTNIYSKVIENTIPARYEKPSLKSSRTGNVIEALRSTMDYILETDPSSIILGEDVGRKGGVFKATEGLWAKYPNRVVDTPLAESSLVGFGIGLAFLGKHPIVEIQFADFIHSAFDQIVSEASKAFYRSDGGWNVPMVIRTPWGGGVHGALYHSQAIEVLFSHIPGIKVVVPSTPKDVVGLLNSAHLDPDPVLFLEHKKAYRMISGPIPEPGFQVPIGQAEIVRPGKDLSIITYGLHRHYALSAAEALQDEADIEVVDLRTISPLDRATILDSATRCSRVLIVHEDNISFGAGAEVAALISEHAFWALDAPVKRLASPDIPLLGFSSAIEQTLMIGTDEIVKAARDLLAI